MSRRKLLQGSLVISDGSQSAIYNPNTKTYLYPSDYLSPNSPPRRQNLSVSCYGFSPKKEPESCLDLSESDTENWKKHDEPKKERQQQEGSTTIFADALTQRLAPNIAEVNVTETVKRSECKVICHSPSRNRLTPKKLDMQSDDHTELKQHRNLSLNDSLIKNTEDCLQTDSADRRQLDEEHVNSRLDEETIVDNHSHSSSSVSDDCNSSSPDGKENLRKQQIVKEQTTLSTSKNQGRVIASKYRLKAATYKADKSQHGTSTCMSLKSKKTQKESSLLQTTPKRKEMSSSKGKSQRQASTPENMSIAPNETFNLSALPQTKHHSNVFNETESFSVPPAYTKEKKGAKNTANKTGPSKSKLSKSQATPSSSGNITQDVLNTEYARYLQWHFLYSKAHKAIEDDETNIMGQLESVWMESRKMHQKLSQLNQEYDRLQHITDLDEVMDIQKSSLGPLVQELPQLHQYYTSMSAALDTTRHELKTHGIAIPDTTQGQLQFEESLMSALDESEQLLAAIASHTRRNVSTTSQYAQAVHMLASGAADQLDQIKNCNELVKAAQTLSMKENSMKIQEIEFSDVQ